jgi:hypothetical protein
MKRVTPESAARLVAIYAARAGLTGRRAPAVDWTFTVEVVPGLSHPGPNGKPVPAWAVVHPKVNPGKGPYPGGKAHVQVRDIDATPIPNFDGDPLFELRVTLAHEALHAVVAEAVAAEGGALTVPAEEQIVEAAAQAIVRSEGTSDARVMARAVRAVPSALRARIAASAGQRARGAGMDPKMVQEALDALIEEGAGEGKCAGILKSILASLAAKGAGGDGAAPPVEPDGDEVAPVEAREEPMDDPNKPKPGDPPAARPVARVDAGRARQQAEDAAITEFRRTVAKDDLIVHVRARLADHPGLAAVEKRIAAAPDFITAKAAADLAIEMVGAGPARARSDVRPAGAKPPESGEKKPKYVAADLIKEGIHPKMAEDIAAEPDDKVADLAAAAARARITQSGSPWPTASKNGSAS